MVALFRYRREWCNLGVRKAMRKARNLAEGREKRRVSFELAGKVLGLFSLEVFGGGRPGQGGGRGDFSVGD